MEIIGEEVLTSNKARELFELGKEWILKRWENERTRVVRIAILPKTIGRNSGFIMDVETAGLYKIRYYAKIQSVRIETVMIHHLLKFTKCGPDDFLIVLLSLKEGESIEHGVITKEVSFGKVTTMWFGESEERLFRNESFLFTFFIALGRFGNLPDNHDNWGIVNLEKKVHRRDARVKSKLMIIDFSSNRSGTDRTFNSYDRFTTAWGRNIYTMFHAGWSPSHLYSERLNKLARQFDWLHSKQTLFTLLHRVCTATDKWLTGAAALCSDSSPPPNTSNHPSNATFPLSPFKNIPTPTLAMSHSGHYVLKSLMNDYASWVYTWNKQLERLFEWFPFPYEPPRVVSVPVAATAPVVAAEPVAVPIVELCNTAVSAPLPETSVCTAAMNNHDASDAAALARVPDTKVAAGSSGT